MARKTRITVALVLSVLLAFGTIPAPAFAEMAEESMGAEPVAVTQPATKPASEAPLASETQPVANPAPLPDPAQDGTLVALQVGEEPVVPQADSAPVADPATVDGAAEAGIATQSVSVSAPRVRADSSMESGQVATWDCVWLGSYPQTEVPETDELKNVSWTDGDATVDGVRYRRISRDDVNYSGYWPDGSGTYRYFRYESIKWRVLEVSDDTAFVIADAALDCRRYHDSLSDVTWETSAVRSWLNGTGTAPYYTSGAQSGRTAQDFASVAFTPEQLANAVRQSTIANASNVTYGTPGGNATTDRVFLLSESEVYGASATAYGFAEGLNTNDEARRCDPTDYARAMGTWVTTLEAYAGNCSWWLRSPGYDASSAAAVGPIGKVYPGGSDAGGDDNKAIRPALKLNLSSSHLSYAGTVSSDGTADEIAPPSSDTDPSDPGTPTSPVQTLTMAVGANSSGSVPNLDVARFFPIDFSARQTIVPVQLSQETNPAEGTVTYRVGVGIGRKDLLDKKESWNQFKANVEAVRKGRMRYSAIRAFAKGFVGTAFSTSGFKAVPELGIMGYGEFKFAGDGQLVTSVSSVVAEADWKAKADWQFVAGVVPVYLQLSGGVTAKALGEVKLDVQKFEAIPKFTLSLEPSIALEGGCGVASVATVGAKGEARVPIQVVPPTKGEFEASASVRVYLVFVVDWSHELGKVGPYTLWDTIGTQSLSAQGDDSVAEGTFSEVDRSYAEATSAWTGGAGGTLSAQGEGGETAFHTLQESVMPNTLPLVAEAGGSKVMVFQQNDPRRATLDSSVLAYSVYEDGAWSEPRPVWDTGTLDAYADLKAVGNDIWVTWQKEKRQITGDVSADAEGVLADMASASEVCVARFDAGRGEFVDARYVTDNDVLDMTPELVEGASGPKVAFARVDDNDLGQRSGATKVLTAAPSGTGWSESALAEGVGRVRELAAFDDDGSTEVAYATTDGDADTRASGSVRLARRGITLTGDGDQPTGLQWEDGRVWWTTDGLVRAYDCATTQISTLNPEAAVGDGTTTHGGAAVGDGMRVLSSGGRASVLWSETNAETATSLLRSAVVGEDGRLSEAVTLRSCDFGLAAFDALPADGGYSVVANAFDVAGTHSLVSSDLGANGSLVTQGASAYVGDDGRAALTYGFVNDGERELGGYAVIVRSGETELLRREVAEVVAPGGSVSGEVVVDLPAGTDPGSLIVDVIPVGQADAPAPATCEVAAETEQSLAEAGTEHPSQITSVEVADAGSYDGRAKEPAVSVRAGEVTVPASGFDVRYENNIDAGEATVEVTGKGSYAGTVRSTFQIARRSVTVTAEDKSKEYGSADPALTATAVGLLGSDTVSYSVSRASGENAGEYAITPTGEAEQGNYAVTYAPGRLTIVAADVACAEVAPIAPQPYTGRDVRPEPAVTLGGRTLAKGADYDLSYANNVGPGTATVTITGKGNFAGSVSATFTIKPALKGFPDVPANAWYAGVVSRAVWLGLMNGYADGKFGPNDSVTRGQVAVILWNMTGGPKAGPGAKDFSDVKSDKYYYRAVRWASSAGVVSGYGNGRFGPDDNVTREQLAAMLANYSKNVAHKPAEGSASDFASMKDKDKVSGWAVSSVGWCFKSGIISGTKDGNVNPHGNTARAEAAKMVVGLHDILG